MKKLIRLTLVLVALASALALALPVADPLARVKPDDPPQSPASSQPKPSAAQSPYLGAQACAACHAEIVEKQQKASMAKALEPISDCQILRSNTDLKFRQGQFSYRITRQGDKSIYNISDGNSEISIPLLYCFGQGKAGQTYVYEYSGAMYESRLSFYKEISGLDITLGHANNIPKTLVEAAGRQISVDETQRCFGCHTTGAVRGSRLQLDHYFPGVSCESCHGPGAQHVAAIKAGEKVSVKMKPLGNLDGDDITQNLCGSCHRGVEDVMALPNRGGISNVRFQPYRMFNSRCYSADKRIGCTSCHDPHEATQTSAAFYDAKCLACHLKQDAKSVATTGKTAAEGEPFARACKVGKTDCAGCHMPKVDLQGAHFKFTDHRIRIVREGAPFPN